MVFAQTIHGNRKSPHVNTVRKANVMSGTTLPQPYTMTA
jgi:hypothetical protein